MGERTEQKLRQLLKELDAINSKRNRLVIKISAQKRQLVENSNYVGIVYIARFLDYEKRNLLFTRFLDRHPGDYLFVLAFADSESSSYQLAEEIADAAYEEDIYAIKEDVEKEKDRVLCLFLDEYEGKEDLSYIYDMVEKYDWMRAYKRVTSKMIDGGL